MPRYRKRASLSLYRSRPRKRKCQDTGSPFKGIKRPCFSTTPQKNKKRLNVFTPSRSSKRSHLFLSPKSSNKHIQVRTSSLGKEQMLNTAYDTAVSTPVRMSVERKKCISKIVKSSNSQRKGKTKLTFSDIPKAYNEESVSDEVKEVTTLLKSLVRDGKFSPENISFKMFLDTLRWHASDNTSGMRYSDETKEFFWTGKRLLGGQFIRFMRGFAHQGLVSEGKSVKGMFEPSDTQINIAVPSDKVLAEFTPSKVPAEETFNPGILNTNIEMSASAMPNTSHVVMFDGKKIIPNSTDIYLLDKEEPNLAAMKESQEKKRKCLEVIIDEVEFSIENGINHVSDINCEKKAALLEKCKGAIKVMSTVTRSLRESYSKKSAYLETLQKKLSENNDDKLKFASNRIRTLMYKMKICLEDLMEVIDILCQLCAEINQARMEFRDKVCDLTQHSAYRELKTPPELRLLLDSDNIPEKFIKQRSPEWFDLRKTTKVTGSVAHNALGLDSLVKQKQYFQSVFCDHTPSEPNEQQKRAMEHGSVNEINAVATLLAKVVPVYYPHYIFHEEGAYPIKNEKGQTILIVSPDGSLNNENTVISVEIKCPFAFYAGNPPVFYNVKPRHIVQCQLEAKVLGAREHLYISWSKETTTVFRMMPNAELLTSVLAEVDQLYYGQYPSVPTKLSESAKLLKQALNGDSDKAEFLGEFKSVISHSSERVLSSNAGPNVYYDQKETRSTYHSEPFTLEKVNQYLQKGSMKMSEAYSYQRPMASEVLVYLMSDMDRSWNREIGHGLPISYLFKGYRLPMKTAHSILEEVLDVCFKSNAHVPCVSFDGQFARLKDYDELDKPLTLFTLQRKFWSEVQKNTKRQLITKISELYKDPDCAFVSEASVNDKGIVVVDKKYGVVQNRDKRCLPIQTSVGGIRAKPKNTSVLEENADADMGLIDGAGLDENVLTILEDTGASIATNSTAEPEMPNGQENTSAQVERDESTDLCTDASRDLTKPSDIITGSLSSTLDDSDYNVIYHMLRDTKRQKWKNMTSEKIEHIFTNAEHMNKELTGQELVPIVKYLNMKVKSSKPTIPHSLRKSEKINAICDLIGNKTVVDVPVKVTRSKSVKALTSLCIMALQKKTYTKDALAVSFAKSYWPCYKHIWLESASVEEEVEIEFINKYGVQINQTTFQPVYSPEYSRKRNQLEVRVMDGTHIRTNIKSKLIRNGLENIKIQAWKKVAFSGKTDLLPAMLEVQHDGKIMHQQSDPFVRTMFCEQVEKAIERNGDIDEATFCRLFRDWHQAEDKAGLSAEERVQRSLRFREWLLTGYDFGRFPPASQYVRGIPRTTFEGLICSIDAHILLYGIVKGGSYNWRSVSTLVAENFMGELAERSQSSHGVPVGSTLPMEMKKISELHCMRLNPNRSFQMKTYKSRAYEVPHDIGVCIDDELGHGALPADPCVQQSGPPTNHTIKCLSTVQVRDHQFDSRKCVAKAKHGRLSKWNEQPKGVQPVRFHYKVDESKILPSLRLGISESNL